MYICTLWNSITAFFLIYYRPQSRERGSLTSGLAAGTSSGWQLSTLMGPEVSPHQAGTSTPTEVRQTAYMCMCVCGIERERGRAFDNQCFFQSTDCWQGIANATCYLNRRENSTIKTHIVPIILTILTNWEMLCNMYNSIIVTNITLNNNILSHLDPSNPPAPTELRVANMSFGPGRVVSARLHWSMPADLDVPVHHYKVSWSWTAVRQSSASSLTKRRKTVREVRADKCYITENAPRSVTAQLLLPTPCGTLPVETMLYILSPLLPKVTYNFLLTFWLFSSKTNSMIIIKLNIKFVSPAKTLYYTLAQCYYTIWCMDSGQISISKLSVWYQTWNTG